MTYWVMFRGFSSSNKEFAKLLQDHIDFDITSYEVDDTVIFGVGEEYNANFLTRDEIDVLANQLNDNIEIMIVPDLEGVDDVEMV